MQAVEVLRKMKFFTGGLIPCPAKSRAMLEKKKGRESMEQKNEAYEFTAWPRNVRQIGSPKEEYPIYIEDFVMTYLHQIFRRMEREQAVVLLGGRGSGQAGEGIFIYGAIALEVEQRRADRQDAVFGHKAWRGVQEQQTRYFPGSEVMGWAYGARTWDGARDALARRIQREHFAREGSVFLARDISEQEEKLFVWENQTLKEMEGYHVFFERNPQMQEYMLQSTEPEQGVEGEYADEVMKNVRQVIENKMTAPAFSAKYLNYSLVVIGILAIVFGANIMLDNTARMKKMEHSVETLSDYVRQSRVADKKVEKTPAPTLKITREPLKKSTVPQGDDGQDPTMAPPQYVVQKGDTFSQILWERYHTLEYSSRIKRLNGIRDENKLSIGQKLVLPAYPQETP